VGDADLRVAQVANLRRADRDGRARGRCALGQGVGRRREHGRRRVDHGAAEGEQIEAALVGRAHREIARRNRGDALAGGGEAAHQDGEEGEEALDRRAREALAQAQRVEAQDAADPARARRERSAHGLARADALDLDLFEAREEELAQLLRAVLVHVVGIHAVRGEDVRRGEDGRAAGGEERCDRVEVGPRVGEVLDHLEAHDEIEAPAPERKRAEVGAHEARSAAAARPVGRDAVEPHHHRAAAGEARRAVARAAAEVEDAPARERGARDLVGDLVAREVEREERVARVQTLAREPGRSAHRASGIGGARASRMYSRAKRAPIAARRAIRPAESTSETAIRVSGGATPRKT
jgi:hypothetical protein